MMALAGVELKTLVSEPDALTTRPPPCDCLKLLIAEPDLHVIEFQS